jgi:hypothetical protein
MTAENFQQTINALLDKRPYTVFTVELHGGERFEVDSPMAIAVRDGVAVVLARGGPIWFDHDSVSRIIGTLADTGP